MMTRRGLTVQRWPIQTFESLVFCKSSTNHSKTEIPARMPKRTNRLSVKGNNFFKIPIAACAKKIPSSGVIAPSSAMASTANFKNCAALFKSLLFNFLPLTKRGFHRGRAMRRWAPLFFYASMRLHREKGKQVFHLPYEAV